MILLGLFYDSYLFYDFGFVFIKKVMLLSKGRTFSVTAQFLSWSSWGHVFTSDAAKGSLIIVM